MSLLLHIFGLLVGFSTVMLTASLVVMCFVRVIQYLANTCGKTLGEMLGSINLGFRFAQGDQVEPGDAAQSSFVLDVLTYPTLHSPTRLSKHALKDRVPEHVQKQRQNLANGVEYLPKEMLEDIVKRLANNEPSNAAGAAGDSQDVVPARWSTHLPSEKRTLTAFFDFVDSWFATAEGASKQQFKVASKRLTVVVSCIVVVLLNLDGIQLATDLFHDASAQDLIASDAPAVLRTAQQLGAGTPGAAPPNDRDSLFNGVQGALDQANGVLNEPSLNLGWQNSWIVKKWCSEPSGHCRGFFSTPLDSFRWIVGLVLSCLLLSLGAPFWADQLKDLLNFQNALDPSHPRAPIAAKKPPAAAQPVGMSESLPPDGSTDAEDTG